MARKPANDTAENKRAVIGDNSTNVAKDRIRSIVNRIERLTEEKAALSNDIKDIYGEAKASGFDVKALRALIAERKKEPAEVEEQRTLIDLYRRALGVEDL
jgi:uncharacterized protein (UPF0335 family)